MRGQDLGSARVIERQPGRVRLGKVPRRPLIHGMTLVVAYRPLSTGRLPLSSLEGFASPKGLSLPFPLLVCLPHPLP